MNIRKLRNDILLITGCVLLTLIVTFVFKANLKKGSYVKVIVDKQEKYCYNFNKDTEVVIQDGQNTNVLVIENGEAYIKEANCPDKICVSHKKISKTGEVIVCLPHKLIVEITEE